MIHYQIPYIQNPPVLNIAQIENENIREQSIKMLAFQKIGVNNVDEFYWYMNV